MEQEVRVLQSAQDLDIRGLTSSVEPWECGLREIPHAGTLEWWYFDAIDESGARVAVFFRTKSLIGTNDPLTPRVNANIALPNGVIAERMEYPAEQFRASREQCAVHIGPNCAQGSLRESEVHIEIENTLVDLQFSAIAPAARVGSGIIDYGSAGHLGWMVPMPRAIVTGEVSANGDRHRFSGIGYFEKGWGTIDFKQVLREWHWVRIHTEQHTLVAFEIRALPTHKESRTSLLIVSDGNQTITAGFGNKATIEGKISGENPSTTQPNLVISYPDLPGTLRAALAPKEILHVKHASDWSYTRYTASAQIEAEALPLTGIERTTGIALGEYTNFQPQDS